MSGQQPGPVPEPTTDAAAAPAPVTRPGGGPVAPGPAAAPFAAQHDAWPPAQAATPGWGAPGHGPAAPAQAATPGWGAPGAAPQGGSTARLWTLKRGLVVGGAALVLAAGAGVGVYALTSSSASADGTTRGAAGAPGGQGPAQGGFAGGMPGQAGPGQGGAGNFSPDGMGGGLAAALHAEYVVLQGGAYVTKAEQLGSVTEVTSGSVTVKSSDGFTRSYALGADVVVSKQQQRRQQAGGSTGSQLGVADIATGATVRIVAAKNGTDYAAESVVLVAATATGQAN
ncbi:hypothetical protein [Arthrobacter sp. PAMC25564]|uniref:hypothetical protein n=1 Tax=Arthrobacter sp. PAMC25564 TaxID=2565366 RepID=UPI00197B2FAD|nr:hypothetical protein [Arthrobacter sp. PAMC25564]